MQASGTQSTRFRPKRHRAALTIAVALLALAPCAWSQSPALQTVPNPLKPQSTQTLPAAQPTQLQPTQLQPARTFASTAISPPSHARVDFADNRLTIAAENSSLDDILSEIARLTGMKITGGVADERVYGSYGPDSAQAVLSQLLDGTGTNMMLLETPQHTLAELILTPRNGGPTPPSSSAGRTEDRIEENLPQPMAPPRRDITPPGRRGHMDNQFGEDFKTPDPSQSGQQPALPQPVTTTSTDGTAQPDTPQPAANGVKTPQQLIYDDLVRQQQQQQPTPNQPPQ